MSLADLLSDMEKQSNEQPSQEPTEEQVKEAYAAGRIAGAAYRDELNKLAQAAKTEEMGEQYKEDEGASSSPSENSENATVDKLRQAINNSQKAKRDNNNDQGANSSENNKDSAGPQPQNPETNEEQDVTASALAQLLS